MGRHRLSLGLFAALLLVTLLTPARSEDKCAAGCVGTPAAASFLSGHKYSYGVEGTVTVRLSGADKQQTSVKVLGQLAVSALGNCAHVLKVVNLVISGPDGKKHKPPRGLEKPVRFTLQDGRLGPELCAEEGDSRRSLNMKRALISLLQWEQKASTQVDVFGACPTDASSSQEGPALLVHRSRDLSRCAHREQGVALVSGALDPNAEIKSSQLLQSSLHVESKVASGVPEKVSAAEEYLYRPFAVGDDGARASVLTKLTLTGKAAGADSGQFSGARTVMFEKPHGGGSEQSNLQAALAAVRLTAQALHSEASSASAGSFAQLIRIFSTTSKDDLLKVYSQVKGNNLEKRVFVDAVVRTGSGASVEVAAQLFKGNDLSALERQLLLLSLGNARHATDEGLKAVAGLLEIPDIPYQAYLGAGALAGVFCRSHDCHHVKNEGVIALSAKFASGLRGCKTKTKREEDTAVAVLKGIRNIRHLEDSLIDKLAHCASDHNAKARVRVAALEAFHADPCAAKLKKSAIDLMKNRQIDSEIRIRAYLAVIACPCTKSATEIKNLLDTEPVHQVGRFITTSLRHIRASANPDKQLAKQHYGLIGTPNKFNVDDRKYSFYRENSFSLDALGAGGSVEQTVIFSQDSFLPRSISLNLTTEIFGHNLNVLELGGRQSNLDLVLEHLAGPKGLLRSHTPQQLYKMLLQKYSEFSNKISSSIRGRRSVKTEVDNFDKHMKDEATHFDNELDMDLYVKLFGSESLFLSLGDDSGWNADRAIAELAKAITSGCDKLKHFQQELRAHLLFLDAELVYPTATGLPLKLRLTGAAAARVDLSTNVDMKQIIGDVQNAKIDVKVVPSVDVEIAGELLVDADAVTTGLKVVTNLHSSTGVHLIAKAIENGLGVDLQLAFPVEKQELVTASHELVLVTAEKGQKETSTPVKVDSERKDYSACFDQLSGVLGITLCGEVSVPFSVSGPEAQLSLSKFVSRFPLAGSSKLKVSLEKNDLRGYHIKLLELRKDKKRGFEVLFEAEGSKNRRTHLVAEAIFEEGEKGLKLNLESPIKSVAAEVSLVNKPSEKLLLLRAMMDQVEYYGKIGLTSQGSDKKRLYKPIAEYQLPDSKGRQALKVDGQLTVEDTGNGVKYDLRGIKANLPGSADTIDVTGHYHQAGKKADLELEAKRGEHSVSLSGSYDTKIAQLQMRNTLNPFVNFKATGHFERGDTIRNDIDVYYGGDCKDPQNRVLMNQLYKGNFITKNKLEIFGIPAKVVLDAEVEADHRMNVEAEGQYADRKVGFKADGRRNAKKAGDYSFKSTAFLDDRRVEVLAKRDVVSDEKSNFENSLDITLGDKKQKYELSGIVLHKNKPEDVNVGANGHFKVSGVGKTEEIKFDIGAIQNPSLYSSHAKISGTMGVVLDYLLKMTRGANQSGQLKLVLKDTIAANGQFKVTDADGKGNGAIIVDFKKSQRKVKADAKFLAKEPTFNADVDVFFNFEKDNSDKVHISTATKRTDGHLESKNKLVYGGKTSEANVKWQGVFEPVGKCQSVVELVLPSERVLALKYKRDVSKKDEAYSGTAEIELSDAPKRGAQGSTVSYKGKAANTNLEKMSIDYEGQIKIELKDGKNLVNNIAFKNVPKGDDGKYDFKSEVQGNLIPKPASLTASGDYTNMESLTDFQENARIKGSYGDDIGFELVSKQQLQLGKANKKNVLEETLTLRLPFEQAHDIKMVSNVLYLIQQGKDTVVEYTISESVQVNAELYKVDASGKLGAHAGGSKLKLLVPHADPLSLDLSYKAGADGEQRAASAEAKALYGKGKSFSVGVDAKAAPKDYSLHLKTLAPQNERFKSLDISLHSKAPAPDTTSSTMTVEADGRVYKAEALVVYSKAQPVIDIKYSSPSAAQPSRLLAKGTALSSSQAKAELSVENVRDFSLRAAVESSLQRDAFALLATGDCERLGLKGARLQLASKEASGGKRLEVAVSNDGKNLVSGSTSFISKQEGTKTIIEGSGSVKVKEEPRSANFKYIRTALTEGNEQGIETFLNLAVGASTYVAETRVTNLENKASYVYCEEKKQCAHVEWNSKISIPKAGVLQHSLSAGLDLRKLGLAPELGAEASLQVSDGGAPQLQLNLHASHHDANYHLHVYNQPEAGKFPAGITVTLPHRVLALESLVTYPADKAMPFPIKGELALHMDKKKPQLKTGARFLVDVTGDDKRHSAVAEFGFSHPRLGKEALLKISGNVQQPGDNSVKFESAALLSHPTLGNDRESKILFEASPAKVKIMVHTPLVKVMELEASAAMQDRQQQAELRFSLLEGKAVHMRLLNKDFQLFEFSSGYSDEKERKMTVIAHLDPEKRVDISADIILPGEKKNIVHGALFLQDNLIKSDYGASKDNFNYFINALKKDVSMLENRIKQIGEKASADFKATLKKVEPTLKQLQKAYKEDLQKLYDEVANDKVLKDISHAFHEIVASLTKMIADVVEATSPIVDKISETLKEFSTKVHDLYEKQIEPQVKQLYESVAQLVREALGGLVELVAHFAALVADFFEKQKPQLQELINTFAEIFKDVTRIVMSQLKELRDRASEQIKDLTQSFQDMPLVNMLKEKWQELAVPEQITNMLTDGYNAIRQLLPTEEVRNFFDALYGYISKKLKQEKVDDAKQLRVIYEKLTVAVTSVLQFLRGQANELGLPSLLSFNALPLMSAPGQTWLPSLGGLPAWSALTQLVRGDMPDVWSLVRGYRLRSLNPLDELPQKLRAVVVNGQHLFTFDGRHLTFPGACRYVLAHDAVDGNFTLVLQLAAGAPKALALVHKDGSVVELNDKGQVSLNGAVHGFPVLGHKLFAFRQPQGRVGMGTDSGLLVLCTAKLEVCYVEVNGFYLGKLRGLLGNGNNEPFDDFKMPNGKISASEADFGNAYKLSTSCSPVKSPSHAHVHSAALPPACEQVFGSASPLRIHSLLLDRAPFLQACVHAVASNPERALGEACDLARGYLALAVTGLLPGAMPAVCLACTDVAGPAPHRLGDSYPWAGKRMADVVVTIETTKRTEKAYRSIAVPLLAKLTDELKAKGVEDVQVHLVGISPKMPYAIIYDTDAKLKNAKPVFDDETRYGPDESNVSDGSPDLQIVEVLKQLRTLNIKLGTTTVARAYHDMLSLPLRPGAAKLALHVVGESCEPHFLLMELLQSAAYRALFAASRYSNAIVAETPGLQLQDAAKKAQLVGWSEDRVLLQGDASPAAQELRSQLHSASDACVDFVHNTGGLVLSATQFFAADEAGRERWLGAAKGSLARQMLAEAPAALSCSCAYADPFQARSVCLPTSAR